MKSFFVYTVFVTMISATSLFAGAAPEIAIDSIISYSVNRPESVPVVTVIRSPIELSDYFTATGIDTAAESLHCDFTKNTFAGVCTVVGGGNRIYYKRLVRIVDDPDTLVIEVRPDSTIYGYDISIQAAAHFVVLSLPRTGKPVIVRVVSSVAVSTPNPAARTTALLSGKPGGLYTLQGRCVQGARSVCSGLLVAARSGTSMRYTSSSHFSGHPGYRIRK